MKLKEKPIFDSSHVQSFSSTSSPSDYLLENNEKCSNLKGKCINRINVRWTLENICQAAQLLKKPPEDVAFVNEHEMRRVYSLIYDVFRCKYTHGTKAFSLTISLHASICHISN